MLTVSDEAIDQLTDAISTAAHFDMLHLPFPRKEPLRQLVRSWLEEHVTYRDITLPQLRAKREAVEEKFGPPPGSLKNE